MTTPDATAVPTADPSRRRELAQQARRLVRPTSVRQLPARSAVALSAACLATLLLVAASAGPAAGWATAAVYAAGAAVVAAGWTRLVGLPSRAGTLRTVGFAALGLVLSVVLPADGAELRWVPAALAVGVVAAFLHQLVRQDGRPRVVTSLSGTLMALGLLAAGVTWVAVPSLEHGGAAVATSWAAVVVCAAVEWACHRARLWGAIVPVSVLAATGAAAMTGSLVGLDVGPSLLLGLACSVVGVATRATFAPLPALVSQRTQAVSGVASVFLAGPLVEVVTRHLVG